jgi:hypothetical protein
MILKAVYGKYAIIETQTLTNMTQQPALISICYTHTTNIEIPCHISFDALSDFEQTQLNSEVNIKHKSTSNVVMQAVNLTV